MKPKITVLGYYHCHNFGDEMFKNVLTSWLHRHYRLEFINTENCKCSDLADSVAVLCGGGDIANKYFLDAINNVIAPIRHKIPVYAVGIGIPYPKMIKWGILDIFDYIIYRNNFDTPLLSDRYHPSRIEHAPDLGFALAEKQIGKANLLVPPSTKRIGVFLSQTILNRNDNDLVAYTELVDQISKLLMYIADLKERKGCRLQSKYEILLIPFCTSENVCENDRLINENVYKCINAVGNYKNIKLANEPLEISTIIPFFRQFEFTICTRFHAHIFSIIAGTPFLSLATTRKVKSLLSHHHLLDCSVNIRVDPQFEYPVSFNILQAIAKFKKLVDNRDIIHEQINSITNTNATVIRATRKHLRNALFYNIQWLEPETPAFNYRVEKSIDKIKNRVQGETSVNENAEIISYILTGNRWSEYNYGIMEQLRAGTFVIEEAVPWILERVYKSKWRENQLLIQNPVKQKYKLWNINYFNQDELRGYHRSGWSYIMEHLAMFSNPAANQIFDPYLDKTFGWNREFYKGLGLLPLCKPWCGFFHHTPNEDYSINNIVECINSPEFIESLKYCKGLFVLSTVLGQWLSKRVKVPIIALIHPTEINVASFNINRFMASRSKKVVQIGAWLRDTYAIYQLNGVQTMSRYALKGKNMDNYYISTKEHEQLVDRMCITTANDASYNPHPICRPSEKTTNKYILGLTKMVKRNWDSVKIIERLTNCEYDQLLTNSVVFIYLEDASAVNTIIECIVRATPILVNRLPAVEEYLGADYPLYYNNFNQAVNILNDLSRIRQGHEYLCKMNLERFSINRFLHNLLNCEIYID